MNTYWVTFRLHDGNDYSYRYKLLTDEIQSLATGGKWWLEPTSFVAFSSSFDIDTVAARIAGTISKSLDLVLVGMSDYKSARVIGANGDNDIYDLMPFARTA
jgi:hypothetical protein